MILLLSVCLYAFGGTAPSKRLEMSPKDTSVQVFWQQFRAAVLADDTEHIILLSSFPISMPTFFPPIKNKKQFKRWYADVFAGDCNAKVCFPDAKPDHITHTGFDIWCRMRDGGDMSIVYHFTKKRAGWRFTSFDNINE